ncbi:hypothetical protein NLU13_8479 [Sarocladium strictum]|uniref:ABC transporter domain-containing protein n=1 Tax=Sarocladium strictum TaxID=5046 RepID=A0AA39L513_SARSR|nr:hypothetical protein NLU13_8479 [Sarocladium strictum]
MPLKTFRSQTWALIKKNLIIIFLRSWFTTFLRYIFPIIFVTILWKIPDFAQDKNQYGMGEATAVRSLEDALGDGKLVLITKGGSLAADLERVLDDITKPLSRANVVYLNGTGESDVLDGLDKECPVNNRGLAPCFGAVVFHDTPLTPGGEDWWNYDIRAAPDQFTGRFNTLKHNDPIDKLFLPLQAAVDNAILNQTELPEAVKFTQVGSQKDAEYDRKIKFLDMISSLVIFFLFITASFVVQHVSAMVAKDRDSGMSDLIDSMSGGAAWARVVSYVVTFDIAYLPLWIILGCLNWALLLRNVSLALVLFWQILGGFAVTSGAVFATAFFRRATAASIAVVLASFFLAVGGAAQHSADPKGIAQFLACGLLFPPMTWVFLFGYLLSGQKVLHDVNLLKPLEGDGEYASANIWTTKFPSIVLFAFLIIQIIGFVALAALVETAFHGKPNRHADFVPESEDEHVAVRTTGLVKVYQSSFSTCWRGKKVKAVDGLDLVSHKNQVLCLLGPNGSGKTTTLDMLAGNQKPTAGSIQLKALPTQLGVCPQKNVLWNKLTVREHLVIWNTLKGGIEGAASIDRLIEKCDLASKRNDQAKTLSGGTKRKLQLACMLIGGSSMCLLDEVTSGLDPLSRRAIWNVILSERSHRTMILTTHFLDEAEVLSDHIFILSWLKTQFGGGYHVSLPKTVDVSHLEYPVTTKDDQYICKVQDSQAAVQVLSGFRNLGNGQACITGPTIEDVFLRVSEQPGPVGAAHCEELTTSGTAGSPLMDRQPTTRIRTFLIQTRALFIKRLIILRSQWWIYLFALALPLVVTYFVGSTLKTYFTPKCSERLPTEPWVFSFDNWQSLNWMTIGPQLVVFRFFSGGLWVPKDSPPTVVMPMNWNPPYLGMGLLNIANQVRSGVNITGGVGEMRSYRENEYYDSLFYIIIVCLMQALYPAFFAIYPAYERRTQVRALQYSNGIRPAPLLTAYLFFDFIFVVVIAAVTTVLMSVAASWWSVFHVFIVLLFHGIAATMLVYLVSRMARSQPGAFVMSFILSGIMYGICIIAVTVANLGVKDQSTIDGVGFGLGIIFPIQNVFRALELGLNSNAIRCRPKGFLTNPSSIYAYAGPVLLLLLQIILLFFLTMYVEGISMAWITRRPKTSIGDGELGLSTGRTDVDAEKTRVVASEVDLLRLLNVSKKFGKNVAVDDVSFGLRGGEIMALLGPNGAGKTTTINMIRGDMAPDSGRIYLEGIDTFANKRLAQQHLGVCPQFDALDMLTVREHLVFYARCKNVPDINNQVDQVMNLVGITPHAGKMAAKLSGGNKRKLSLAIALLVNPPVLILDEPSSAMDASSKRVLWKTLQAVAPGRSVLITTHSMEEADALSTRAVILAKRMLAIGTIRELREAYSNEYHVHLVLKSAPTSSGIEMEEVASWVRDTFGSQVQIDGENLGGQVRFIVPIDSPVPPSASGTAGPQNFVQYMIETLEGSKEALGIDCYSINTATMERVFLSVMKNSDMDEDTSVEKRKWWQF